MRMTLAVVVASLCAITAVFCVIVAFQAVIQGAWPHAAIRAGCAAANAALFAINLRTYRQLKASAR